MPEPVIAAGKVVHVFKKKTVLSSPPQGHAEAILAGSSQRSIILHQPRAPKQGGSMGQKIHLTPAMRLHLHKIQ